MLFVNTGIAKFAPVSAVDEDFFDAQFDINVRGAYFVIKHAAPIMSDEGSITLTSSTAGVSGGEAMSVYAASKAAVRSFGRTFAAEFAPRRIRVNTVSPGPIETPIFDKAGLTAEQLAAFAEGMIARIPLKRIGQADEVARRRCSSPPTRRRSRRERNCSWMGHGRGPTGCNRDPPPGQG